jgi:hypothetical protein
MRIASGIVALALTGCLAGAVAAAAPAGALDGKTFVAQSGEKGKPAQRETDTIQFQGGKFHSAACDPYGFGEAAYTASVKDGVVSWQAVTTSEKEGTIRWKGEVRGEKLSGAYTWTKAGQAAIEYWLKGSLKK